MNKQIIAISISALLLGGIAGYMVANKDQFMTSHMSRTTDDNTPMGMHRMSDGSLMANDAPGMDNMGHMMDMMVTSERAFIEGMIPHHQEAVDTAKEVLARGGTTPEVVALVEGIIAAQEQEIATMKGWYQDWYGETYTETDSYQPMMRELENLSGAALDRAFLSDMIMHHMGAIMMAKSVTPYIEHSEIRELTEAIVETQSAEIEQMRAMLEGI